MRLNQHICRISPWIVVKFDNLCNMGEWPTLGRPETSVMVTNHKPGNETFQNWVHAEILRHQTLLSYSLLHIIIIIISSDPRRRRTMLWTFFKTTTKHWPKQKENKTLDILGHNGGGGGGREAGLVGETWTRRHLSSLSLCFVLSMRIIWQIILQQDQNRKTNLGSLEDQGQWKDQDKGL